MLSVAQHLQAIRLLKCILVLLTIRIAGRHFQPHIEPSQDHHEISWERNSGNMRYDGYSTTREWLETVFSFSGPWLAVSVPWSGIIKASWRPSHWRSYYEEDAQVCSWLSIMKIGFNCQSGSGYLRIAPSMALAHVLAKASRKTKKGCDRIKRTLEVLNQYGECVDCHYFLGCISPSSVNLYSVHSRQSEPENGHR